MGWLRVGVYARDPLVHAGLTKTLRSRSEFEVLGPAGHAEAEVGIFSADRLTPQVTAALCRWAGETRAPVVLVVNEVTEAELRTVVQHRVVAVLPRHAATPARLADSVLAAAATRAVVPPHRAGQLLQHDWADPAAGLKSREIDVLRLMADGMDTAQIARELRYSDRTVKYVIYGITHRLALRNRSHAVAYAIRAGVI